MTAGPEFINVPAGGKASYQLTFKPLAMSSPEQPHEGSVFFPIPDGTGLLYRLLGRAESPVAEGSIVREVVAKAPHTEVLKVSPPAGPGAKPPHMIMRHIAVMPAATTR